MGGVTMEALIGDNKLRSGAKNNRYKNKKFKSIVGAVFKVSWMLVAGFLWEIKFCTFWPGQKSTNRMLKPCRGPTRVFPDF